MTHAAARFLDLWLDAHDVPSVARFWAAALDMRMASPIEGAVRLAGQHPWDSLWIRQAPQHALGCAIHVDVSAEHITRFLELGAQVVDASSYPWVVLAGPEDSEICAFPTEAGTRSAGRRILDLVIDTPDPADAAAWWADVLGTGYHASADDAYAWVEPVPGAVIDSIVFAGQEVPLTSATCRLRPRVATHDLGALFARGATRAPDAGPGETMLVDPSGNEFLVQVADLVVRADDE